MKQISLVVLAASLLVSCGGINMDELVCRLQGGTWENGTCIPAPTPTPEPTPTPTPTPTPEPTPTPDPDPTPPPPSTCTLGTPPASAVPNATIKIQRSGARNVTATPVGEFGKAYYCTPEMNWPEACAAGRSFGPVAPDGHPQRVACEQQFLGACGPMFSMSSCTGTPEQCPITFDPFYVQDGVNQNHPANVAAGCGGWLTDDPSWVKDADGHILKGRFWMSMPSGKGYILACDATGTICGVSSFEIDQ